MRKLRLDVTPKQQAFLSATADEVLYGGAAGGGKSYGQVLDAMLFAFRYPRSKQLILRRTFPELDKSIIRQAVEIFPAETYQYNRQEHTFRMKNGSVIDCGYLAGEGDVTRYQSAEYDVIRFDELTHFTEYQYLYMLSRVRGVNGYPKQVKSSTNPGGIGHEFVKRRFIDAGTPMREWKAEHGTRLYIPAKVQENSFLMRDDPEYVKRLQNLPEMERRALLDGDWDIFAGQYFSEWRRDIHVTEPFSIPAWWRRYVALDYGFDMLAVLWIAVDDGGKAVVYREFCSGRDNEDAGGRPLVISEAAEAILSHTYGERIDAYYAPPDLWNRRQDSGESVAELFARRGIGLSKASNARVQGWMALREWLRPIRTEDGGVSAALRVFATCKELIRCMPLLQYDDRDPSDVAREPHAVTHAPDALRYFVAGRPMPGVIPVERDEETPDYDQQVSNFLDFGM